MSDDKLQEIIELEEQGYRATAIRRLRVYLREHPDSAEGWYYLARFLTHPRQQRAAIERALKLQSEYPEAREFRAILLEEYPNLETGFFSRGFKIGALILLLLVLAGVALAVGISTFLEEQPQEVIVIVPTSETPTATVPPLIAATSTPTELPTVVETPTEPPPTVAANIISATPPPTPVPVETTAGTEAVLIAPLMNDPQNTAVELSAALVTTFNQSHLFFNVINSPVSSSADAASLLEQENAVLVIYGAVEDEQINLQVYAQEKSIPLPGLLPFRRLQTPWQLDLHIPVNAMSSNLAELIGVVGYIGYAHQTVIDSLEPTFSASSVLDENQQKLAFMLGYSYQVLGQAEDALRIYDLLNTYSQEPDPATAANRAYAIAQTGDAESAVKLYLSMMDNDPDTAFIESNIGTIHLMSGDTNAAQLAFEEAIRLNPDSPRPYVERGKLLKSQNQFNRALEDFSTAIQLDAAYTPAYYERAVIRVELDLLDEALQDINQAVELLPGSADFYALRGHILMQQENWELASTAFEQALRLGAESADLYTELAAAYFELGNLDGTIRESNNALTLDKDLAEAWYQRGRAYLAQNQLGSAINDLSQGLERDPEHVDLLVARCTANARSGDDGAAAADCDSALALDGENGAALEQRGLIRARAGDRAGAASDFQEAIVYDPNTYEAFYYLGLYALQERRYEEAIRLLTRSLDIAPFLGKAYAARGVAYRISGAWELAVADLEQALKIVPEDVYSHYELGLAKRSMADRAYESGNNAQAQDLYEDASEAFLNFLNSSQPQDQYVPEAQAALNYVNSALNVIKGQQ